MVTRPTERAPSYGQWIGENPVDGQQPVLVVSNIEKRDPTRAQILSTSLEFPRFRSCSYGTVTASNGKTFGTISETKLFDISNGSLRPIQEVWNEMEIKGKCPTETTYQAEATGFETVVRYENNAGGKGQFSIRNTIEEPACKADHEWTWEEFKAKILGQYGGLKEVYFRGVPDRDYKLRSSFHRSHRYDLIRYREEDVPVLSQRINSQSSYYYRIENPNDLGALLSLAQHHGYPTPLLDWSRSPFVAAFFAFRRHLFGSGGSKMPLKVRVFVFDATRWHRKLNDSSWLTDPLPNLTFHEFPAHNNPRYLPQQSVASFGNVDDLEWFISWREAKKNIKFLTRIDLPIEDTFKAMNDLRLMGVSGASLFPGFDGMCESLRDAFFSQ